MSLVKTAEYVASVWHKGQMYGSVPYVEHLRHVVQYLSAETHNEDILCVGWLHDILEETEMSYDTLKTIFGATIADAVLALTKIGSETYPEYVKRVKSNIIASIVKSADTASNYSASMKDKAISNRRAEFYRQQLAILGAS